MMLLTELSYINGIMLMSYIMLRELHYINGIKLHYGSGFTLCQYNNVALTEWHSFSCIKIYQWIYVTLIELHYLNGIILNNVHRIMLHYINRIILCQ